MTEAASPNTKRVSVAHPVPRDPDAYRATIHFGQRINERVPSEHRDEIVRALFRRGRCQGASPPENTDADDVRQAFAFEAMVHERRWRLVVGIRAIAFREPDRKHLALTIMEVEDDE